VPRGDESNRRGLFRNFEVLICEFLGVQWLESSDQEDLLGSRMRIKVWVKAVETATNPEFNEVHSELYKMAKKLHADKEIQGQASL